MVAALALAAGCAGLGSETKTTPVGLSPGLAGLRVRVRRESGPLDQEVGAALETELARSGVAIAIDDRAPSDADVKVSLDLRSVGPVVEGVATASLERAGALIDRVSTPLDVYRRDRFAPLVARQLAEALAKSPRVASLAGVPAQEPAAPPPPPVAVASPPPPDASPISPPPATAPPPAAVVTPMASPAGPPALGRSGLFGVGFGLELQLGWAEVFAPSGSRAGVHLGLGIQVDMGPRAAFRLPISFVASGSGEDELAELSIVPTYIYRFRSETEQTFVPYVGLGLNLVFVDSARGVLGRPDTGMRTPDSCGRHNTSYTRDCAFAISPAPTAGIEWQANRLFALDLGASYSFAHLTSSAGLVSWVHVLAIYVGPRLTF
jgi:hypothetical protein